VGTESPDQTNLASRWLEARVLPFIRRRRVILLALVSVLIGSAYATSIMGLRALDVTDLSWLGSDAITEYLGWAFMRQNPVTALPLTLTDRVGYPLTTSLAHFDIVPLVAILLLPISRLLPADFQYYGPLQCLCAAALFYCGYELGRLYCRSEMARFAAGAFVMTNVVFTLRLGLHSALTAHFFLIWVIYEFAKRSRFGEAENASGAARRSALVLTACGVVVALGFNPYIALMTIALVAAYAADLALTDKRSRRFVIAVGVFGSATIALFAWFFGYIGHSAKDIAAPGFGLYSANLNALVNPSGFSRFLPPLGSVDALQSEGSAYLGVAGFLGFVITVCAVTRSRDCRRRLRPFVPACCAAVVAFVFSLSHRITLGSRVILHVPLPDAVLGAMSVFRSSARFAWPLVYVIYALSIASIGLVIPRRFQAACIGLLAITQWIELSPLRATVKSLITVNPYAPVSLQSEAFLRLGERHRHLVVLPAWQCGPTQSPGGANGYATLGLVAARQRMTINSYYSGRYSERSLRVHCQGIPADLFRAGPDGDSAYVVDSQYLNWFGANARASHECGERDGFNLCVKLGTLY
jgi:hypothetical protein